MNRFIIVLACVLLSACGVPDVEIDSTYVKDCNGRGGRVERIEYSSALQCVGAYKEITKGRE